MANRNYANSRIYSNHVMPVALDCLIAIGATGAPTIASGNGLGIKSITRMAAGQYRLRLEDNFAKLLAFNAKMVSPVTGSGIAATALTPGLVYQIVTMGTTTQANWVTAGVPADITAAVGVTFLCAATSSGTGTGKLLGSSGVTTVELLGTSINMLNAQPVVALSGGYVDFQTLGGLITMGAYTPAGTVAAPTFTGDALATHTHDLLFIGGITATEAVAIQGGDTLGKNAATNRTIAGSASATKGGVVAVTAGTPSGTNSAPAFTGTAASLTGTIANAAVDPTNGSSIRVSLLLSNSKVSGGN